MKIKLGPCEHLFTQLLSQIFQSQTLFNDVINNTGTGRCISFPVSTHRIRNTGRTNILDPRASNNASHHEIQDRHPKIDPGPPKSLKTKPASCRSAKSTGRRFLQQCLSKSDTSKRETEKKTKRKEVFLIVEVRKGTAAIARRSVIRAIQSFTPLSRESRPEVTVTIAARVSKTTETFAPRFLKIFRSGAPLRLNLKLLRRSSQFPLNRNW